MIRRLALISLLLFTNAFPQRVDACSFDDSNGDGLILSTGQAIISGKSLIVLNGIRYNNENYDNVPINLDVATLRWSVSPPYPAPGLLDLTTASVVLTGDNDIRLQKISYGGVLYNATIVLNLDGTFSAKDATLWQEFSTDEAKISDFSSWNGSGGLDAASEDNRRYTLNLCDTQSLTIELDSQVDNYLYLLDDGGNIIAENDDRDIDGGNYNAAIDVTLTRGIYTIVVATRFPGETDVFDISIGPDPNEPASDELGQVLNLQAIAGTDFVNYASVAGRVSDAETGEPIVGAEIEVFGFIPGTGFSSAVVYSGSTGDYFLRLFANRLTANTFNARAAAAGCNPSPDQFGIINADSHAVINFDLDCVTQPDTDNDPDDGNDSGDEFQSGLSLSLDSANCSAVRFSFGTIQYNEVNLAGTASGPVGATIPGNTECSAWTNCERQVGESATTSWTYYSTTTTASPQSWSVTLHGKIQSTSIIAAVNCPTV